MRFPPAVRCPGACSREELPREDWTPTKHRLPRSIARDTVLRSNSVPSVSLIMCTVYSWDVRCALCRRLVRGVLEYKNCETVQARRAAERKKRNENSDSDSTEEVKQDEHDNPR